MSARLTEICGEPPESGLTVKTDSRAHWISLVSAPGQGNTSLLEHFQQRSGKDSYGFSETRVILVRESYTRLDQPPQALDPIARTVFELHVSTYRAWHKRLKKRLREFHFRRFLTNSALIFLLLLAVVVIQDADWPLHPLSLAWWRALFGDIARESQLHKLIADGLVALLLAIVVELGMRALKSDEDAERAGQQKEERLNREMESFRRSGEGLFGALLDQSRKFRALVLLIDNAYALPLEEKLLLQDFLLPSPGRSAMRQFHEKQRILLVTLDMQDTIWTVPKESKQSFQRKVVSHFTPLELQDIVRHNLPTLSAKETSRLVDEAESNVKSLFAQASELGARVQKEYLQAGTPGRFGLSDLMAYWAVCQRPSVEKAKLIAWLINLDPEHLRMFDLASPINADSLLAGLSTSCIVKADRHTLYFDGAACEALRKWMQDDAQERPVLARAHYFWLTDAAKLFTSGGVSPKRTSFTPDQQLAIKQAAWRETKLRKLSANWDLPAQAHLPPDERARRQQEVAATLVYAAVISRMDGDVTVATALLESALRWLPPRTDDRKDWIAFAAQELWSAYWMSGDRSIQEQLQSIVRDWPDIVADPRWSVPRRHFELLEGRPTLGPEISQPLEGQPDLTNIHRLTSLFEAVRQSHGFLSDGLSDAAISVPGPVIAQEEEWAELALWRLRVLAYCLRKDEPNQEGTLSQWRDRLFSVEFGKLPIEMQALYECEVAGYWHVVLMCWTQRAEQLEEVPEDEAPTIRQQHLDWFAKQFPASVKLVEPDNLFEDIQLHYRRALRIAALLENWQLLLEGGFHLGSLLLRFTPGSQRGREDAWWKEWEALFEGCLRIEQQVGWNFYAPEIHRLRWQFFEREDRPTSITDAYNALQSAKQGQYPDAVVLYWHDLVGTLLTNYGHGTEDQKRSAELHEMWAHDLAHREAALASRTFKKSLPLEQARTLVFAAQARRRIPEYELADKVLTDAETLYAAATASDHGENPKEVYDLGIALRMQRAWLEGSRKDSVRAHELFRAIWRDLQPDCQHNANVLLNLVRAEEDAKLLHESWPSDQTRTPDSDSENQAFSLPAEWFKGPDSLTVQNRFEFRFRQLVHMVSTRRLTSEMELMLSAAAMNWHGLERFGETVLGFAEIGLHGGYLAATKPLMVILLKAVAFYFASVDPDDEHEMEAFRLLMKCEPLSSEHRTNYVAVLVRHKELLKREMHMRGIRQADWYGMAARLDYYFTVLVDDKLLNGKLRERLIRSGETPEQFETTVRSLRDALPRARSSWSISNYSQCQQELEPIINMRHHAWVFVEYLEALDLWLRCEQRLDLPLRPLAAERSSLLRSLTLSYIGQLGAVISDQQAQHLALELLDEMQASQETTARGGRVAA